MMEKVRIGAVPGFYSPGIPTEQIQTKTIQIQTNTINPSYLLDAARQMTVEQRQELKRLLFPELDVGK